MNDSTRNTDSGLEVSNNATNSRSSASPTPSPRRVRSPRDSELCATADIPVISPEQIDVLSSHRLGKGTYGHVVRARYRPNTQAEWRTVAIKYANEAIMRNTLKREAKIMHQLQYNKHCIKIYGIYNCLRNGVGVVMEYMDCKSLAELLVNKNIDYKIDNAISWLCQLSDAVDYFHSKEQVHRDLKCQNLLLSDRYRCLKLCDFGTFTTLHNSMTSNRGTPITMAPEIFRGEQYNTKCDIYSFGIIMWQVIARRNPYSKVDANVLLWNVASTNRRPPELTCHPILLQFYKRCWHHDQNMRPSSSEVKEYFAILREYYPNGNEPLIDTSTNEPARTPQPSQITNGHALLSYGQGGSARLHPYGHRRAGSDGSTLIVKERLPTDPPVQHLGDGGIGPVAGPPDMRTTRSQSVADGLGHIRGSATPTAPRARLSSETDDTEDILEFFDSNFHPAPPDPRDPASLQLRDEHIALLHVLHDHIMKRDAKFREKHSMIRTLDQLEECKKRRDLRDRLKTELEKMSTPKAAKAATSATERALKIVENSSRVRVQDLKDNFGAKTARGFVTKYTNHYGKSLGALDSAAKPPLGWIWGNFFQPWQRLFPGMKQFNADVNLRREVAPLTLIELARLIDLGWVDANHRIDLVTLLRTRRFDLNPGLRQCGFYLTEQGADIFKYPIDIEVQYANQSAIAAIEQVGGRIRCAYYDQRSVEAAVDPLKWFRSGQPIPSRRAPPPSLIEYYTSPANRGYLCSEEELSQARKEMSMVRGYNLPENEVRLGEKHKNQVFSCLPPGAIVSVADRKVFAPTGEAHVKYYTEEAKADATYS